MEIPMQICESTALQTACLAKTKFEWLCQDGFLPRKASLVKKRWVFLLFKSFAILRFCNWFWNCVGNVLFWLRLGPTIAFSKAHFLAIMIFLPRALLWEFGERERWQKRYQKRKKVQKMSPFPVPILLGPYKSFPNKLAAIGKKIKHFSSLFGKAAAEVQEIHLFPSSFPSFPQCQCHK